MEEPAAAGAWVPNAEPAAAATQQQYPITEEEIQAESLEPEVVSHNMEIMENYIRNLTFFQEAAHNLEAETNTMSMKMHRYPIIIRDLGDWYTVPRVVAIGPYHHTRPELKKIEHVKHAAVYHCISEAGCSEQEMYGDVASAADEVRRLYLYDKDVMEGFSRDDFRDMMFFDACFLVQYMAWFVYVSHDEMDPSLSSFFYSNRSGIHHDVWLLENQLPWMVVQAVLKYRKRVDDEDLLEKFVAPWRDLLRDRQDLKEKPFVLDDSYDPPHLLAHLRCNIVGRSQRPVRDEYGSLSFSNSAVELAEIGITLKASETPELANMGLTKKGFLFGELTLAPLSLGYARASRLVNMAAFEICVSPVFVEAPVEDSALCSYLLLLSILVKREEDVHELRRQGILEAAEAGGFTDKQALDFFTSL